MSKKIIFRLKYELIETGTVQDIRDDKINFIFIVNNIECENQIRIPGINELIVNNGHRFLVKEIAQTNINETDDNIIYETIIGLVSENTIIRIEEREKEEKRKKMELDSKFLFDYLELLKDDLKPKKWGFQNLTKQKGYNNPIQF